jgi:hypothetical protein
MKVKCAICERERSDTACKVFVLTASEKEGLRKMGVTPPARQYYCRPCFRILENPASAVELMKGVLQAQAQALGASNAEEAANKFKAKLLARMHLKPTS